MIYLAGRYPVKIGAFYYEYKNIIISYSFCEGYKNIIETFQLDISYIKINFQNV